jgi:hypothetical protein
VADLAPDRCAVQGCRRPTATDCDVFCQPCDDWWRISPEMDRLQAAIDRGLRGPALLAIKRCALADFATRLSLERRHG